MIGGALVSLVVRGRKTPLFQMMLMRRIKTTQTIIIHNDPDDDLNDYDQVDDHFNHDELYDDDLISISCSSWAEYAAFLDDTDGYGE